jgi:hypothetical protein
MAEFILMPAVTLGVIIGVYEILLIHRDVKVASHRFGHGLHAIVFAVIATLSTFNVGWLLDNLTFLQGIPVISTPLALQILIGLITAVKIHGVSAAIKTTVGGTVGLKETWFHSLLIGALVVAAPYAYPLVEPVMPEWLK